MEYQSMDYLLCVGPEEDDQFLNGVKVQMALPAGEERSEGESGQGQPGSGATAAEGKGVELSGEGPSAAGPWNQNLNQGGTEAVWPGPAPTGKCSSSHRFARWQLQELELAFLRSHYITAEVRKQLAASLGVSETKVKNWFHRKRALYKKYQQP